MLTGMMLDDVLLYDNYLSSAISHAEFDPLSLTITVTFHHGDTYSYPCSINTWLAYLESSSRGGFFNEHFR